MSMQQSHEVEIDQNYEAFQKVVGSLMPTHAGQFAVLRRQVVVDYYKTAGEALIAAYQKYPDGLFSVQEVADRPLDLGFYSHVANNR